MTLLTIAQACDHAKHTITPRGLRFACAAGHVPGAQKVGRDWILPSDGLDHYLQNRPKPGRH